ncbi:S1 family peptidase [Flaviflexus huanghaiensis]|uniref:S1 family peptidase n=1 Tax=Flaviflexus huanghaiensis TaxID=1111473 RepID=UPI0015F9F2CC|nr:S1 family peptidase [Flaviflexus huanghaiensis]
MRRRIVPSLFLTSALALGALGAQPAFAEVNDESAVIEQTVQEAEVFDAALLAEDLGVTEDVADQWFEGEDEFLAALDYAFEAAGDEYFSSAWTPENESSTGHKAWVSFKGEVPADVTDRFAALAFSVDVRLDAEHTEAELEDIREELMTELYAAAELDGLTGDFTDDGGIEIEYTLADTESDPAEFEALLETALDEAPVVVEAEEVEGIEPVEEVVRGGTGISGCTLGFTVTKSSTRGALTAGHCPNSAGRPTGSSVALAFKAQHIGASGDIQWHSTSDSIRNQIRVTSSGVTRSITSRGTGANGSSVCNYGKTRSVSSCTTIRRANHAFINKDGKHVKQMVQTNGTFTNGGDSGGPWFSGNSARGIHFGKSGGYSTYTKINSALSKLGLTLKTS